MTTGGVPAMDEVDGHEADGYVMRAHSVSQAGLISSLLQTILKLYVIAIHSAF